MPLSRKTIPLLLMLALALTATRGAGANSIDQDKVRKIKSAYILNFIKFAVWPDEAFASDQSPIVLTVLCNDPLGQVLSDSIAGKTAHDRRIVVENQPYRGVQDPSDLASLRQSHVVYLCQSEQPRLSAVLDGLANAPVLTISDTPRFAHLGGMIGFVMQQGRIVFEINPAAVKHAGLRLSSKLLKLAKIVNTEADQ